MFSFFKKKYPTTVNPRLQAQLQRIESFPETKIAPSSGDTCTKYAARGKPPEVTLSGKEDDVRSANVGGFIGYVVNDRAHGAVLLTNVEGDKSRGTHIEAWQLVSAQDLQLTRQIPIQIGPDDSDWITRVLEEAVCLPNGRVLFVIGGYHSKLGSRGISYLFDTERQRFSPFVADVQPILSIYLESQRLNADTAIVRYLTDVKREAPEVYINYYHRFQLFTSGHPDGVEVLSLGIDIGSAERWVVIDKTLYLHTADPRTPDNPREAYWSLDLSKLLTDRAGGAAASTAFSRISNNDQ